MFQITDSFLENLNVCWLLIDTLRTTTQDDLKKDAKNIRGKQIPPTISKRDWNRVLVLYS